MLFDQVLVTRSSSNVLCFKLLKNGQWEMYQKFEKMRGNIFFIRGNVRIQIVTHAKIYFVIFNQETLEAKIEAAMYNFMGCDQMMFGPLVRNGITYKSNEQGFLVWKRKYYHNFKC